MCICEKCLKERGEDDTDNYKLLRGSLFKNIDDEKKTSYINIPTSLQFYLHKYQVERVIRECIDRPKGIVPDSVYELLPDIRF